VRFWASKSSEPEEAFYEKVSSNHPEQRYKKCEMVDFEKLTHFSLRNRLVTLMKDLPKTFEVKSIPPMTVIPQTVNKETEIFNIDKIF
jgi:hypothetical protein